MSWFDTLTLSLCAAVLLWFSVALFGSLLERVGHGLRRLRALRHRIVSGRETGTDNQMRLQAGL